MSYGWVDMSPVLDYDADADTHNDADAYTQRRLYRQTRSVFIN